MNEKLFFISNPPSKIVEDSDKALNDRDRILIKNKSLGTWVFNTRKRKRVYIALSGKTYYGLDAFIKYKQDKNILLNSSLTPKSELIFLVKSKQDKSFFQKNYSKVSKETKKLSFWGFPDILCKKYKDKGVIELFNWQIDCLVIDEFKLLSPPFGNLIYSAPTSGGKTLVAEILMLRNIAYNSPNPHDPNYFNLRKGTIFFVVPFIAIAEEKMEYFQNIWGELNIGIKSFHGSEDDGGVNGNRLGEDVDVAICTIERANILLNQLIEESREDQLKMIVIDEIHMLSDSNRGFLLEVMLSKVKFIYKNTIPIIGMSATLPNIDVLAQWLDASLYITKFRPVDLDIKICKSRKIFNTPKELKLKDGNIDSFHSLSSFDEFFQYERDLDPSPKAELNRVDDGLDQLCIESLEKKKSVILFCNSKKRCELCAQNIMKTISDEKYRATKFFSKSIPQSHLHEELDVLNGRKNLIAKLSQSVVGLCPILRQTLVHGIAYHHAGLTIEERKVIEEGFRTGFILILCTTSTLSAGVNLPANRVIIRSPKMGDQFLSISSFRQMCGRAGRMGYDSKGEAILMISDSLVERNLSIKLTIGEVEPLISTLHKGKGGGLEKLLLEMISCNKLQKESNVLDFIDCTLMRVQHNYKEIKEHTKQALFFLKKEQFVLTTSSASELSPSPLGIATTNSGISPKDAVQIIKPLISARQRLIIKGGLHPVFLVTPPSTHIEPDWVRYQKILDVLFKEHPDSIAVAEYLGVNHGELCSLALNSPSLSNQSEKVNFYRRFYSSVLLFILIQEWPIYRVANLTSNITRGQLQQLQRDASVFCGMTVVFCKNLNWKPLASCLESYTGRLNYGVNRDLLPLVKICSEISNTRARLFYKNSIKDAKDIIASGAEIISQILFDSLPFNELNPLRDSCNQRSVDETEKSNQLKTQHRGACMKLATHIIERAKDHLQQELFY